MDSEGFELIRIESNRRIITAMIRLVFGVQTLSRTRLSVSPAIEAVEWLKLAATARRHPVFGAPGPGARGALRHPDVELLVDLLTAGTTSYMPDLLTPQPRTGPAERILDTQLAEIEATGQNDVEAQVLGTVEAHAGRPLPTRIRRLAESGGLPRRLAAGIARFWRETLHDDWPSLHTVLDRDIAERSRAAARHGVGRVFDGLHPSVHWIGDSLTIDTHHDHVVDLSDHDFVLAATALSWPTLMFQVDRVPQTTVYYPTNRLGTVDRRDPAGLPEVIGAMRTVLLSDLAIARSTKELATRHGVAASTISYHLSALRRARLVSRHQDGRHVLYQRTERAGSLVDNA
ncbi:winged helix-turn-helix domain-containing protein [Micromonospora sp. NPDC023956]|uniref:ArsR/SmtB family transcription factor n=1 Tax=Micromonospora sp. NPDC023956 TaxID=3155722 RepID=UPI0033CB0F4D